MCGRYQAWVEDDELMEILEIEKLGSAARYLRQQEVFPGTLQPLLFGSAVRIRAHLSLWGVSLASVGRKGTVINARAETAADKPLFRPAFAPQSSGHTPAGRRAAALTSGYYEWSGGVKYHITDGDGGPLFLGALELDAPDAAEIANIPSPDALPGKDDEPPRSHVILTVPAEGEPARIHNRMPLFLRRAELEAWFYDTEYARRRLLEPWTRPMRVEPA